MSIDSAVLLVLPVHLDWQMSRLVSRVSNLFPNQGHCLKLYLPLPVCLICHCVFWLVVLFSDFSLCFLTCYFVFEFVIVFSDLLYFFLNCCCVFGIVILFVRFIFAFVICYFVFRIVISFALLGHRKKVIWINILLYFLYISTSLFAFMSVFFTSCRKHNFVLFYKADCFIKQMVEKCHGKKIIDIFLCTHDCTRCLWPTIAQLSCHLI